MISRTLVQTPDYATEMEQEREREVAEEEQTESLPMSHKEQELDKTRTFFLALEELQSLRPQLYQAADYCEHQYLFGDNKQGVLDNLKDYSVKALVNAVDHLGTVAFKLNDLFSLQNEEIDDCQLATSAVAQRLRSCQEHSDREGLKQQSMAKTMHVNHKQYTLPADEMDPVPPRAGQRMLVRETFDLSQPAPLTRMHTAVVAESTQSQLPLPHTPRSDKNEPQEAQELSGPQTWYFADEFAAIASLNEPDSGRSTSIAKQPPPSQLSSRTSFLNRAGNTSFKRATSIQPSRSAVSPTNRFAEGPPSAGAPARSITTRSGSIAPVRATPMRSGSMTPLRTPPASVVAAAKNHNLEKTMFLTPSAPPIEAKNNKGKGILRSLLGRKT